MTDKLRPALDQMTIFLVEACLRAPVWGLGGFSMRYFELFLAEIRSIRLHVSADVR